MLPKRCSETRQRRLRSAHSRLQMAVYPILALDGMPNLEKYLLLVESNFQAQLHQFGDAFERWSTEIDAALLRVELYSKPLHCDGLDPMAT